MLSGDRSPSPCSSNYDFTLRHERVKLFTQVLKKFDTHISRTSQAVRELITCFALVGQSYHEVSLCVNNTNPNSTVNRSYNISYNNRLVENYGADLQYAAKMFSNELTKVRDGQAYTDYNTSVHKNIFSRLHSVMEQSKKVCSAGDAVAHALKKHTHARTLAEKKEAKYERLERPLTESKRYPKQSAERDATEKVYLAKLTFFNQEYETLMQRHLYVTGHTVDDFLDLNFSYMTQLMQVLGCLAPHGADTMEAMIVHGNDLGKKMGLSSDALLGSKVRRMPVCASGGCEKGDAAPDDHSSRILRSAHNFTNYYGNRTDDDGVEDGPRTARDCRAVSGAPISAAGSLPMADSEEPQPVPPVPSLQQEGATAAIKSGAPAACTPLSAAPSAAGNPLAGLKTTPANPMTPSSTAAVTPAGTAVPPEMSTRIKQVPPAASAAAPEPASDKGKKPVLDQKAITPAAYFAPVSTAAVATTTAAPDLAKPSTTPSAAAAAAQKLKSATAGRRATTDLAKTKSAAASKPLQQQQQASGNGSAAVGTPTSGRSAIQHTTATTNAKPFAQGRRTAPVKSPRTATQKVPAAAAAQVAAVVPQTLPREENNASFGAGCTPAFDKTRPSSTSPSAEAAFKEKCRPSSVVTESFGVAKKQQPHPHSHQQQQLQKKQQQQFKKNNEMGEPKPSMAAAQQQEQQPLPSSQYVRAKSREPIDDEDAATDLEMTVSAMTASRMTTVSSRPNHIVGKAADARALPLSHFVDPAAAAVTPPSPASNDSVVSASSMPGFRAMPSAPPQETASEIDELNSTIPSGDDVSGVPTAATSMALQDDPLNGSSGAEYQPRLTVPSILHAPGQRGGTGNGRRSGVRLSVSFASMSHLKEGRSKQGDEEEDTCDEDHSSNAMTPETNGPMASPPNGDTCMNPWDRDNEHEYSVER